MVTFNEEWWGGGGPGVREERAARNVDKEDGVNTEVDREAEAQCATDGGTGWQPAGRWTAGREPCKGGGGARGRRCDDMVAKGGYGCSGGSGFSGHLMT